MNNKIFYLTVISTVQHTTISMSAETIIKVTLVVLFLLYAYFMIGGYTPCPAQRPYPGYSNGYEYMDSPCDSRPYYHPTPQPHTDTFYREPSRATNSEFSNPRSLDGNIYQMGPYLNF